MPIRGIGMGARFSGPQAGQFGRPTASTPRCRSQTLLHSRVFYLLRSGWAPHAAWEWGQLIFCGAGRLQSPPSDFPPRQTSPSCPRAHFARALCCVGGPHWHVCGSAASPNPRYLCRSLANCALSNNDTEGIRTPCGQSPMDFEPISLTARTQCHAANPKA